MIPVVCNVYQKGHNPVTFMLPMRVRELTYTRKIYSSIKTKNKDAVEQVWPSGKVLMLVSGWHWFDSHLASPFTWNIVVKGHCLGTLTLPLTMTVTLKCLSSLPI